MLKIPVHTVQNLHTNYFNCFHVGTYVFHFYKVRMHLAHFQKYVNVSIALWEPFEIIEQGIVSNRHVPLYLNGNQLTNLSFDELY